MDKNVKTAFGSGTEAALTIFKGVLLGIANIIPGVSGGTFALILGIYERLLKALHAIDMSSFRTLLSLITSGFSRKSREDTAALLQRMDARFLICLGIGGISAIFSLSFLIDWLLTNHPAFTLSFFIGLIIPSIAVPWRMMGSGKSPTAYLWIIPGIVLTVALSFSFGRFSQSGDSLIWSFTTGMIAISAMILPGISGSFVMLVMGQYQNVLKKLQGVQTSLAAAQFDFFSWLWLGTFALGCIIGLLLFARLLGFLLKRYRTATLAFLIGLIIGSFWVLWPFKDYSVPPDLSSVAVEFQDELSEKQDILVATAPNRMPVSISEILMNLLFFGLGFAGALGMNSLGKDEVSSYSA
jgi:putative membrane protein